MKRQTMKQGRRPKDLQLAVKHYQRQQTKRDLRTYRYLRMPRPTSFEDGLQMGFVLGNLFGFGVLALVMTIAGLVS